MFEKLNLLIPLGNFVRNKSIQNFLFLAVIQSSNVLISIISVPLIIQRIGVDQFGLVNLALSVIAFLNIIVGFGYNFSGPRETAIHQKDSAKLSEIFSSILLSKLGIASLLTVLIFLSIRFAQVFEGYSTILLFSTVILFSEALLLVWFFQGIERTWTIAIANLFSKITYLIIIVFFIKSPENSVWVNFSLGMTGLIINAGVILYAIYFLQIKLIQVRLSVINQSIRENSKLFFYNLISHFSVNGGTIILSFFETSAQLGMYGLVEKIMITLRFFPSLIISATFPKASYLLIHEPAIYKRFILKITVIAVAISTLISLLAFGFAPWIIKLLAKSYLEDSILYLKILCFIPLLSSLNIYNTITFLTKNSQKTLIVASMATSIYMILATTLLTHLYGPTGLCFGLLSCEFFTFVCCTILRLMKKNQQLDFNDLHVE